MEHTIHKPKQPIFLELKFKDVEEAASLYENLRTWTPSGGWSDLAEEFFQALRDVADDN